MKQIRTPYRVSKEVVNLIRRTRFIAFDFDGVFTDNSVYCFEDGREAVRCWRGDGLGLRKLERIGIKPIILSTEINQVVARRSGKLNIYCEHGLADKLCRLKDILSEEGLDMKQAAFVGNDINDIACLKEVGLPIVVKDAHPDTLSYARYITEKPGGYGAVREICDLFESVFGAPAPS